jgi:hypothetical protein
MSNTEDYIPKETESHNGNGARKIFNLTPAVDDRTLRILGVRRLVCEDPDLSDGAKNLFTWLLDASLAWSANHRDGVITISTTKLGEKLHRSKRAIYKWKKELVLKGLVWITQWFMPNTWPLDTFHITVLDAQEADVNRTIARDGMWGNGATRVRPQLGTGAREAHQLPLSAAVKVFKGVRSTKRHPGGPEPKNANLAENLGGGCRKMPLSVAQKGTCQPHKTTPENRTKGTLPTAQKGTGQPHKTYLLNRTKGHRTTARNGTGQPHQSAVIKESKSKKKTEIGIGDAPPARQDWEKRLKKMFPRELEAIKADLVKQQKLVDPADSAQVLDFTHRIHLIDEQLYGGRAPTAVKAAKPARVARVAPEKPLSEAELLDGARYLMQTGKEHLLSEAQRQALRRAA